MHHLTIPVPPGWTRTDTPGWIIVEGDVPDRKDVWRNRHVKVMLACDGTYLGWKGGMLSIKQELWIDKYNYTLRRTENAAWRRSGVGGPRLLGTLLSVLVHNGERGW